MSLKYFTGCNNITGGGKNQSSDTALTALGLCETEPVNNADGVDVKPGTTAKYTRILNKVYSKTTDSFGKTFANNVGCSNVTKTRANRLKGKYELGKMWKYRKTLKKLLTATGQAAASGTPKGERNMYSIKGNGHTGVKHSKAAAGDYCLYPMSSAK